MRSHRLEKGACWKFTENIAPADFLFSTGGGNDLSLEETLTVACVI